MQSYSVEAVLKATGAEQFASAFRNAADSAGKFQQVGGKMKSVGKTMTKAVTLPIVGMGTAIMMTGAKFDDQMSTVQAVTGATGEEMDKMRGQAKELGKTTRFSASEAGEGMEMLARAGFETSEVMEAMPAVLDLAAAGAVDLGDAADITSNILSGFGMEAEETARVADILAQASADSNTDVQGLGEAFKYVGPIASDLGVSIEDTAAAIGFLGDAGIQGGQAGRQLRSGLQSLAAPTKEAEKTMKDLGIEVFDAEGNMKSMPEVVGQLEKGLDGMSSKQKAAALETLFGADAMSAWSILVNEGKDNLGDFSDELSNSEGAAGDMADVMEDNLAGSMRSLKSALEGLAIGFSEMGEGPIRSLVDKFTELVRWFDNLSDSTKQWIIIVAGVAAAVGPILLVLGTIMTFIPKLIAGFKLLGIVIGAITSPIGLVVAAIIAAATLIYIYWEPIKEFFINLWESILEAFSTMKENLVEGWANAKENITEAWSGLTEFFSNLWSGIQEGAANAWNETIETMTNFRDRTMEIIGNVYEWLNEKTNGTFGEVVSIIQAYLMTGWEIIKSIWTYIKNTFSNTLAFLKALVTGDFEGMKAAMQAQMQNAQQLLANIWNAIKSNIGAALGSILSSLISHFSQMVSNATSKANEILTAMKTVFSNILSTIVEYMSNAVTILTDFIRQMPAAVISFTGDMMSAGKGIIQGLIAGIKNMAGKAVDAVKGVVGDAIAGAKNLLGINSPSKVFMQFGEWTGEGLVRGMNSTTDLISQASERMANASTFNPSDIGGHVDSIHNQAQTRLNTELQADVSYGKQPIVINVYDNKEAVRAYVNENNAVDSVVRRF